MGYKLVALDLDGTIYDHKVHDGIPPKIKKAINSVKEAGAVVTIATGRMFNSTLPFCTQLGLTKPVICYQGALIGDPVSRRVLWEKPIPLDLARGVIRTVEEIGLSPYIFVRDRFYVKEMTPRIEQYEKVMDIKAEIVGDPEGHLQEQPTKLVVVGEEPEISDVTPKVKEAFGSSISVIRTYDHLCEIGHPDGSKAKALGYLADRLGVKREEVIAVGDSPNDIDMIEWAGLGVAMASGSSEALEVADMVVDSVSEDGVADLLNGLLDQGRVSSLV